MTLGQLSWFTRLLNGKPSGTITSLQILETVDGNSGRARCKLQQSRLLFRIPATNALPELLDDLIILGVATVISVLLPVLHIDISDTADEQLKLALIKDIDEVCGDQLVEAGDEGVELFRYALLDAPFCDQTVGWLVTLLS